MKKFLLKLANCNVIAALALTVVTVMANSTCAFIAHQAEMPEDAKKLRKF